MKVKIEYKNIGRNKFCEVRVYKGKKEFIEEMIYEELEKHLISSEIVFDMNKLISNKTTDVYAGFHKVGSLKLR
jgi:hypothetical protein